MSDRGPSPDAPWGGLDDRRAADGASNGRDPAVSVIMPVRNEALHLAEAVGGVLGQDYVGPIELVLALGPSSDRTDEVAQQLARADSRITLVPNPSGRTPDGLNAAIAASRHPIVVRVDGHSVLPRDYISTAVQVLSSTGADNVGGVMAAEGTTPFERAVARAMTSRFGVGGSAFHTGGQPGPVDTVYLGVFRREALDRVGGYDPAFTRAQDWEMNHRIRSTGGIVWFTPELRVVYRPRPNVRRLARQYFEYGRWRRQVAREHPGTLNLRYLAAPAAVLGIGVGFGLALLSVPGPDVLRWGLAAPAGYLLVVLGASVVTGRGLDPAAWVRLPVAYMGMHLPWGAGFVTSVRDLRSGSTVERPLPLGPPSGSA